MYAAQGFSGIGNILFLKLMVDTEVSILQFFFYLLYVLHFMCVKIVHNFC